MAAAGREAVLVTAGAVAGPGGRGRADQNDMARGAHREWEGGTEGGRTSGVTIDHTLHVTEWGCRLVDSRCDAVVDGCI